MNATWTTVLDSLNEKSTSVRAGLANWEPNQGALSPYKCIHYRDYIFEDYRYIDWSDHYRATGLAALCKLSNLFVALLFYDTIFLSLNSCSFERFDDFHDFKWRDVDKIAALARKGRVRFYLTSQAPEYAASEFLKPLFEEFEPLHLVHASARRARLTNFPTAIDALIESTTEIPHVKEHIERFAKANHMSLEVADATTCYTLQELYYKGHHSLVAAAHDLLIVETPTALEFIWSLRRAIVDPEFASPGIPHALELRDYSRYFRAASRAMHRQRISLPGEVGAVIAQYLSFPTPHDWDTLQWCEDNLDTQSLRAAFLTMDREATSRLKQGAIGEELRAALTEAWQQKQRSVGRTKAKIFWTTSLALAVGGTLVTEPLTGLLTALGMTAASNLWLDPAAIAVSKMLEPQSFHIWDTQRRLGRKR